ncbi:MAG: hypothetical protein ACTH31_15050 [Pseudoclavibacter sp.]
MQARKFAIAAAAAATLALGLAACGEEPATDDDMTTPMSTEEMDTGMGTGMDDEGGMDDDAEMGDDEMGDEEMNDDGGMDGEDMENGEAESEG